jgi:hypothetical protein
MSKINIQIISSTVNLPQKSNNNYIKFNRMCQRNEGLCNHRSKEAEDTSKIHQK